MHEAGEMAVIAACYAAVGTNVNVVDEEGMDGWPIGVCEDKRLKHNRLRQLVIAGALIAAEIDRINRGGHEA